MLYGIHYPGGIPTAKVKVEASEVEWGAFGCDIFAGRLQLGAAGPLEGGGKGCLGGQVLLQPFWQAFQYKVVRVEHQTEDEAVGELVSKPGAGTQVGLITGTLVWVLVEAEGNPMTFVQVIACGNCRVGLAQHYGVVGLAFKGDIREVVKIGKSEHLAVHLIDQGFFIKGEAGCSPGQELAVVLKVYQFHGTSLLV